MAKKLKKGIFITFEGSEGTGKSTHSRRLLRDLVSDGYDVVHTAEPGGTLFGRMIRDILLQKDDIKLSKWAELFLFEADRSQHVEEIIYPALQANKIVICDRFNTATYAYQGYGLGMPMGLIQSIDVAATGGISPDITILLDLDVNTGLARARSKGSADKIEKRPVQFHEDVRQGYLALAEQSTERIKVIKVKEKIDETYSLVKKEVYAFIERNKGSD